MGIIHVIKIGGKVLEDEALLQTALKGATQLNEPKVIVHGGGRTASRLADRLGIETKMVEGRRVTDAAMLEVICMAYSALNKQIVSSVQAQGCDAIGLCGADLDLIRAKKRTGWEVDYGFVGDIEEVQSIHFIELLRNDFVPVVSPITHDGAGQLLNTNADTVASEIAQALELYAPVRLVYCFELPGLLRDPSDSGSCIKLLNQIDYEQLKLDGTISGGMIPKLDNAFKAIEQGVMQVIICSPDAIGQLNAPAFPGTIISN